MALEGTCPACSGVWTYYDAAGVRVVCALCEHPFVLGEAQPAAAPPTARPVARSWRVGDVVDDLYDVRALLGEGGMGQVFRVHHRAWRLDLAAKCPRVEALEAIGGRDAFVHEAETWVDLGIHPNVVTCHYVRDLDGLPRVFAELVEGGSLADRIASRALYDGAHARATATILDAAIQLAFGLERAHERGLVHQDVKPANAMVTRDGVVKLTDFGIARARPANAGRGESVAYGGRTDKYCSPEQAARRRVTAQSDVWSWGLVLLEMFYGDSPWMTGVAAPDALEELLASGPAHPHAPPIPPAVADLLLRCFRDDPRDRPPSMRAAADELRAAYASVAGRPYPRATPFAADLIADSLNNRAVSLFDLGRREEATAVLAQARAADPRHAHAAYNTSVLEYREGRRAERDAVVDIERLVDAAPADWEMAWLLGCFHVERGDANAARAAFARAKNAARGDAVTLEVIARAESTAHAPARAVEHAMIPAAHRIAACATGLAVITDRALAWLGPDLRVRWSVDLPRPVCVAVSPDGSVAATADESGAIALWDTARGAYLAGWQHAVRAVHASRSVAVACLALSTAAKLVAVGSGDGDLVVVDVGARRPIFREAVAPHVQAIVTGVDISPEGGWIAAAASSLELGSSSVVALVWPRARNEAHWTWPEVNAPARFDDPAMAMSSIAHMFNASSARCAAVLSDDRRFVVVTSELEDRITFLDVESRGAARSIGAEHGRPRGVTRVARGAGVLATIGAMDSTARIRDMASARTLVSIAGANDAAWIGSALVTLAPDGRLSRWEIATPIPAPAAVVRPRALSETAAEQVAFERHLAEAREARARGELVAEVRALRAARAIPGYARAPRALAHQESLVPRTARGAYRGAWIDRSFAAPVRAVALAADGSRFVTASLGELAFGESATASITARIALGAGRLISFAATPDLGCVVAGTEDSRLRVFAARSFDLRGPERAQHCVAVDPRARFAASVSALGNHAMDRGVWLWPLTEGATARAIDDHASGAGLVAIAADGDAIVSVSYDEVRVASASGARAPYRLASTRGSDTAWAIAVAPRAIFLARRAPGAAAYVDVLDRATGRRVGVLTGPPAGMGELAVSADGAVLAGAGEDGVVYLWDTATLRALDAIAQESRALSAVALSADATRAIACGGDRVCIYSVDWEREPR